jgi:hypothetical protein
MRKYPTDCYPSAFQEQTEPAADCDSVAFLGAKLLEIGAAVRYNITRAARD